MNQKTEVILSCVDVFVLYLSFYCAITCFLFWCRLRSGGCTHASFMGNFGF